MKTKVAKACAIAMGMILAGASICSPLQVVAAPRSAEELPETIELPIAIMDYNADNLLFQYDWSDAVGGELALTGTVMESVDGTKRVNKGTTSDGVEVYVMQGMVESELSDTGFPVYRKEVVEAVAKLVQQQLISPPANNIINGETTARFKEMQATLASDSTGVKNAQNITNNVDGRLTTDYFFKEGNGDDIGWKPVGMDGYTTAGRDLKDADGNTVWVHDYGIWHYVDGTHQLSKSVTGLDAATTYTLAGKFEGTSMEVQVEDSEGNVLQIMSDPSGSQALAEISFDGVTEVNLVLTANGGGCRLNELTLSDGVSTRTLVSNTATQVFSNSGWYPVDSTLLTENGSAQLQDADGNVWWKFDGDGLVNNGDSSEVYTDVELTAGKEYLVTYNAGGGQSLHISVYDGTDGSTLLASEVKNGTLITPTQSTVRVVVQGTGDPTLTDWTQNKLVNLSFVHANIALGTYDETVAKYADSTKGYNDISTCMDYAYYMLNNLYNRDADSNISYDGYKKIVLNQLTSGEDDYGFYADESGVASVKEAKVYLDAEKKEIRNDDQGVYQGLFPLDNADSYVDSEKNLYKDIQGNYHNFHFAIRSHAAFYYDDSADLYFDFVGDDDVYLFINGKLAMDIGGAHQAAHDRIYIDDLASELGLVNGNCYSFDFFYLERCTDFSNLAIETNIQLLDDGSVTLNLYDEDGNLLSDGAKVKKGSTVQLEYEFRANVDNIQLINFTDAGLGVEIGTGGLTLGDKITMDDAGITVTVLNADKTVKETITFTTAEDVTAYFNALVLNANEVLKVSGMNYVANEALDANLMVEYTSPNYAGIGGGSEEKEDTDEGEVGLISDPVPNPDPTPEPEPDPQPDPQPEPDPDPTPEPAPTPDPTPKTPDKTDTPTTISEVTTSVSTPVVTSSVPKTGDETPITLYVIGILFGFAGIGFVLYLKKKEVQ